MDTIIQDALGKEWCLSLEKITWVLPLLIENKLNPRSWQVSKFITSNVHALGIETKTSKFEGQIFTDLQTEKRVLWKPKQQSFLYLLWRYHVVIIWCRNTAESESQTF